jgi:hypothetical protein
VDPRVGLDRCGKSHPTGIRSPDRPARTLSLYRLSYTAHELVNYIPHIGLIIVTCVCRTFVSIVEHDFINYVLHYTDSKHQLLFISAD